MPGELPNGANNALMGNVLQLMQEMSPRDLDALRTLKQHNLILVEGKITPVAASLGCDILALPLPPETQVLTVLRGEKALFPAQVDTLQEGDVVVMLTSVRHEAYIRQVLTSPNPILYTEEEAVSPSADGLKS